MSRSKVTRRMMITGFAIGGAGGTVFAPSVIARGQTMLGINVGLLPIVNRAVHIALREK